MAFISKMINNLQHVYNTALPGLELWSYLVLYTAVAEKLTSVQSPETELGMAVQLFQTWQPCAGVEHVVLLVPWGLVVRC